LSEERYASGPEQERTLLLFPHRQLFLWREPRIVAESEIPGLIWQVLRENINPGGTFQNCLRRTGDTESVRDIKTGLMWQLAGSVISSAPQMYCWLQESNREKMSGYDDWRLPTIYEALSLLGRKRKARVIYSPVL
jgi:hypothetical protein